MQLSVDTHTQQWAQELVDCYTGPCPTLSGVETQGSAMLEQARSRMAAVLVVDVASGRVEAAASAHTNCYAAHHSGVIMRDCVSLPQPSRERPWKVSNQALHGEVMPGSLAKLPMALALLRERSPLTRSEDAFLTAIRRSDTEAFIDNALCLDGQFNSGCIVRRLTAIQQAARDLGGCADTSDCLGLNLFGQQSPQALMINPSAILRSAAPRLDPISVKDCFHNAGANRWRGCKGVTLVATVAELFGQGNATSSPPGVAQSLVHLANAANATGAAASAPSISILTPISEAQSGSGQVSIAPAHAQRLLRAMLEPLKPGGTAHLACLKTLAGPVQADPSLLNCHGTGHFVVAGKTGTPLFPHDQLTYQQRMEQCDRVKHQNPSIAQQHQMARCLVAPYKWFGSLLGERLANGQIHWSKAIVVLAERNWAKSGLIDTPLDRGGNVAVELAMRTAYRLTQESKPKQPGELP